MRRIAGGDAEDSMAVWRSARSWVVEGLRRVTATPLPELFARAVGVSWALVMAWVFAVASLDRRPEFTSRLECGTDPQDILRPGEVLDTGSLGFVVGAHCSNPRYYADGHITLRYGGADFDVETTTLSIGGQTYFKIMSVGGQTAP